MRKFLLVAVVAAVALSIAVDVSAQARKVPAPTPVEEKPAPALDPNAQQFIKGMVKHVSSPNARIRFAVREALVAMAHEAAPALKEAKAAEANAHVKAFIDRTLARIKRSSKTKGRNRFFSSFSGGRDIDRIAMDLNLTFDEMAKLEPIYKKYDKNRKELMAEMKESGGFSDPGAWKDLQEEMKLIADESNPELVDLLGEKRAKRAKRYLNQGGFGGFPGIFSGDGGSVQILGGPGEGGMGVRIIKRTEKPDK